VGFVLTVFGAGWLVGGASSLAKMFRVSNLVIGLTIVSLGTSMPEFVVSFLSAFRGSTDIAVGNVVGSNVFNTLCILGLVAMVSPISVQKSTVWAEIPFSLFAALLLLFLVNDSRLVTEAENVVSFWDGILLLFFFPVFMFYSFKMARKQKVEDAGPAKLYTVPVSFLLVATVILGLFGGGRLMVTGAVDLAKFLGISEAVIGLTVVSIGTSIPEPATSLMAARRRNPDIAIGNVIGSNIFNIFFILGASATLSPLPFQEQLNSGLMICISSSLLLFLFMFVGSPGKLTRPQGFIFFLIYVAYTTYLVIKA
jgi:cation:H+ antiporter